MASAQGLVVGGVEALAVAVGGVEVLGMAIGDKLIYEKGAEVFDFISAPDTAERYETVTFVIETNQQTNNLLTYTVSGSSLTPLSKSIQSTEDLPNNRRRIAFTVSFSSRGSRTLRVYGSTNSTESGRSLNYIDHTIQIT